MNRSRSLVLAATALVVASAAAAQYQSVQYQLTTYMKCKPGKAAACDQYFETNLHKAMQARIDKGILTGYVLSRLLDPIANEAGYSHSYTITSNAPFPAEPSPDYSKAGPEALGLTSEQYLAAGNDVRDIVSRVRTTRVDLQGGAVEKGDFVRTYLLKSAPGKRGELRQYMTTMRGPYMAQLAASGRLRGWQYRTLMFRGENDAYDALEHWTYKNAETVMSAPPPIEQQQALFKKAHPTGSFQTYVDQGRDLIHTMMVRTSKVIDVIRK